MSEPRFTILVNSSDGFRDCWDPFFTLFLKYWPNCPYDIILNTENEKYTFDGLKVASSNVGVRPDGSRYTWSECFIKMLLQVKTPFVLYFQEDYFLEDFVNVQLVDKFFNYMVNDREIKYIGLTHFGNQGPFSNSEYSELVKVGQTTPYRISTQVGFWRTETLLSYLRPDENGWMFEIFGTKRAHKRKELFLTTDRKKHSVDSGNFIFKYIHTGIIKGKWHPDIPRVFEENSIAINFSQRGFYEPKISLFRKIETFRSMLNKPVLFCKKLLFNR